MSIQKHIEFLILLTVETAEFEPETFDQAIQHKGWEIAIDQEMDSITRN